MVSLFIIRLCSFYFFYYQCKLAMADSVVLTHSGGTVAQDI
jgi:hypothetical protein